MDFMLNIILVTFVVGLFSIMFITPAIMNRGLIKMSKTDEIVETSEMVLCCIPVFNHFYGWKRYGGSYMSISGISSLMLYIVAIARVFIMYFMFENNDIQIISIYVFLIAFLLFWILNAVDVFRILSDTGLYSLGSKLINSICIILGQVTIGLYTPKMVRYYATKKKNGLYE